MPTTYAHWRFGSDCIKTLPEELQNAVNNHREIYDFGVHGPDILFYDLTHKELPRYGSAMHHKPGREFFSECVRVYNENPDDKEAMLSYILGFLSHYTLDSKCHGYVNRKDAVSNDLSHNKIEAEYDGHMMRLDGRNVALTDRAESLKPDKKDAAIIARFFPFDQKQIYRTCRCHHFLIHALVCHSNFKRKAYARILNRIGLKDYRDLLVQTSEHPSCKDSNLRLDKLRADALKLYPVLVKDLMNALKTGSELCTYFDNDFDPEDDSIKVLPYDEELNYKTEQNI